MHDEYRTVIGYLDTPINSTYDEQGRPNLGLAKILFEIDDDLITPINQEKYFDDRTEVFFTESFGKLQSRFDNKLIKIKVTNNKNVGDNQTNYVAFENSVTAFKNHEIYSFIYSKLPDASVSHVRLNTLPHTKIFFIIDDGFAFGPFLLGRDEDDKKSDLAIGKLIPACGKINGFPSIQVGTILKFNFDEFKKNNKNVITATENEYYLTDVSRIEIVKNNITEYVTIEQFALYLSTLKQSKVIKKINANLLIKQFNDSNSPFSRQKRAELVDLINRCTYSEDIIKELALIVTNEPSCRNVLDTALESEKIKFNERWSKSAEKASNELSIQLSSIKKEIEFLDAKRIKATRDLADLDGEITEKTEQLQSEHFEKELAKKKAQVDSSIKLLNDELKILQDKHGYYSNLDELTIKVEEKEIDFDYLRRNIDKKNDTLKDLENKLVENELILQGKLRDMIPYVSSIIHSPLPKIEKKIELSSIERATIADDDNIKVRQLASDFIRTITSKFNNDDRMYSAGFIASILLAQQQTFITILSGPPGIGKTSFIRMYKDYIGQEDRFLEVAVGRSWTTERELIGFHNSLTGVYSAAPTGVYQYFKGIEQDQGNNCPPHTLLLDEANLSPMEHYGSIFLNIADQEASRKLQIGESTIKLPDSLNIIATVNHDMTTESLSPRLLDRAAVIPFDSIVFDINNPLINDLDNEFNVKVSAATVETLFGKNTVYIDKDTLESLPVSIDKFMNILASKDSDLGVMFNISKRKQYIIKHYIATLVSLLQQVDSIQYEEALQNACDYAILYYILPVINGNGTLKRLESLVNHCSENNFQLSENKLTDMIERGKYHLDTFNFFHY
jgi:hypothetical protein